MHPDKNKSKWLVSVLALVAAMTANTEPDEEQDSEQPESNKDIEDFDVILGK